MKVPPASTYRSRIANDVGSSVVVPNIMAPRLSTLTSRRVAGCWPMVRYFMRLLSQDRWARRSPPNTLRRQAPAGAAPGGDRDVFVPGDERRAQPLGRPGLAEVLEPAEHLVVEDPQADPGHAVADAVVRADAERQVPVRLAPDVERRGVGEGRVVPVRRPGPDHYGLARGDRRVVHHDVAGRVPEQVVDRRRPAQALLHR